MKANKKVIKVLYRPVTADEKKIQQRIDEAFDLIFEEVLRLINSQNKNNVT